MTYILFGLASLAVFHFVYESILAPSLRLKLRFELFALRDELRALKMEQGAHLEDQHFDYLQGSLNTLIAILHRFGFGTLRAVEQKMRDDPRARQQLEERIRILDDCTSADFQAIRARSLRVAERAVGVNNGGWVPYLLPIAFYMIGLDHLKNLIKAFATIPAPDIEEYVSGPDRQFAPLR